MMHINYKGCSKQSARTLVRGFTTPSEHRNERANSFHANAGGGKPRTRGFTLVETLVAISIIALAMIGPFQAVQNALSTSYVARDQLVATHLAQEGAEYIRGIRDGNYLYKFANPSTTRSWLYGLDGTGGSASCVSPAKCAIDPTQNTVTVCTGACTPLRLSTTYLYTQANPVGSTATRYTRTVTITSVTASSVTYTVTVTWTTLAKAYTITVTDSLSDWL